MSRPAIYIETTIVSYLTAWPSRDVVRSADQITTRDWWETQRDRFDLFTSELVILEASAGDMDAAQRRVAVLKMLAIADTSAGTDQLASALIAAGAVPSIAARDAIHIATAATNGIDYLLTWNCTHLANAMLRDKIVQTCTEAGYRAPIIATPSELFDEAYYERRNKRPD